MNNKFTYRDGRIVIHRIQKQTRKILKFIESNEIYNETLLDLHCNDTGNAKRLLLYCQDFIKFDLETQHWAYWNGKFWDYNSMMHIRLIAHAVMDKYLVIAQNSEDLEDARQKELVKHAVHSNNNRKIQNMLEVAKDLNYTENFKSEKYLLNAKNGVIDLRTGKLKKHNKKYNCTQICEINYNPSAKSKRFKKYVLEIASYDMEFVEYLQRVSGYCATAETCEEEMYFLLGDGSNGKSKFIESINYVLGSYAGQFPVSALTGIHSSAGHATPELIPLVNKRLTYTDELNEDDRLNDGMVKALTGGSNIPIRNLYKGFLSIAITFKIVVDTNYPPNFRHFDSAAKRRVVIIPFSNKFEGKNKDKKISEKLKADSEYILKWIVDGAVQYYKDGKVKRCDKVNQATKKYCENADSIGAFLSLNVIKSPGNQIMSSVLYNYYKEFCSNSGYIPVDIKSFSRTLESRGFIKQQKRQGAYFMNIVIN